MAPPASGPLHPADPDRKPAPELLIDPAISRRKFEREIAEYRRFEREYLRRGWLLVQAEYPEVVVVFTAPKLNPPPVLFAVAIDFTNYDLWAPSVRFVNPFSLEPLRMAEIPIWFYQLRPIQVMPAAAAPDQAAQDPLGEGPQEASAAEGNAESAVAAAKPPGAESPPAGPGVARYQPERLVLAMADERPFLCVVGVREYHEHPFHSNDPWLAHRGTGAGRLYHLLNVLYQHGVRPLTGYNLQITQLQVALAGYQRNLDAVPVGPPA